MAKHVGEMSGCLEERVVLTYLAMISSGFYTTAIAENVFQGLNKRFCIDFDQRERCSICIIYELSRCSRSSLSLRECGLEDLGLPPLGVCLGVSPCHPCLF